MSSEHSARPRNARGRAAVAGWGAGVLFLVGALLVVLGSCGDNAGPPEPSASAAGTIDDSGSAGSTVSWTTAPEPHTAPSSNMVPRSKAATDGGTNRPHPQERSSSSRPPATRTSIVVPSFGPPAVKGPVLAPSPPVSIAIPAISVSAPVSDLGLLADGSIAVPPLEETNETGWYTGSPAPGVQGPSVILGHVDSAKSGPSVFYSLGTLKPGAEVSVARQDGTVAVFRVDGVREYGKNQFPTDIVYGNLDHAGLRLITCGGTFDPKAGHYESNIVAFASLVSSHRASG